MPSTTPRPSMATQALVAILGGAAVLVIVASLVAWLAPSAFGDQPATCLAAPNARCFCEAVGTGLLRQPANALSSLAFCIAAVVALTTTTTATATTTATTTTMTTAASSSATSTTGPPIPSASASANSGRRPARHTPEGVLTPVVALTLVALGAGSLAYHAQLTFAGQLLDVQGMYLLGTLLVVGALWRRGAISPRGAAALAVALLAALLAAQAAFPDTRRWLFALVLLPGIALEWSLARRSRPLGAAVIALAIAYAAWLADDRGLWCERTSWLQGHAVWHVLTAVSGALLVPHYARTWAARERQNAPGVDAGGAGELSRRQAQM